ncbi:hypothetical protein [Acetobacter oryzifermentans]|uniref:Phage protein n=1 Tax=Acetobacter oryzifermentans TaxID=1633874 RepID=A0ABN4NV90_9PROT|nr:hypothetical protein [Acetobacter oryzifermentans]ANA14172.1 hypothetical protein WG31_09280 [Acetobacter oryzifermentans]
MFREKIAELLRTTTDAGQNVFTHRTAPVKPELLPVIFVAIPSEAGSSFGRCQPGFNKIVKVEVVAKVSGGTPQAVQQNMDRIAEQIEMSVMCDQDLQRSISQVTDFNLEQGLLDDAEDHLGGVKITFGLEYQQDYPVSGVALQEITGLVGTEEGITAPGLRVDFPQ